MPTVVHTRVDRQYPPTRFHRGRRAAMLTVGLHRRRSLTMTLAGRVGAAVGRAAQAEGSLSVTGRRSLLFFARRSPGVRAGTRPHYRRGLLSTGSNCGVLGAHRRASPSPRRIRRNHRVETAMPAAITNMVTPVLNSTKLPRDWLSRNHSPRAALVTRANVHSREIRRKNRCT